MTLDTSIKKYKQGLKDSDKTLKELESLAAEMVNKLDEAHDAEAVFEDAQTRLSNVTADKETVKEALSDAVLTGTGDMEALRGQYAQLNAEEDTIRGQLGDLTKKLEDSTVDRKEVARIRAQLRRVSTGGSELLDAVREATQADSAALRTRVDAVQSKLPDADDLDTLYALGFTDKADGYRDAIERNENIRPGSGDQMRDMLHREVQRVLTRA